MCNLQYVFFECSTEVLQPNRRTPKKWIHSKLKSGDHHQPLKQAIHIHTGFFVSQCVVSGWCQRAAKTLRRIDLRGTGFGGQTWGPGVRTETQTRWGPRSLLFSWMYPYSYIHLQPWFFIGLNLGLFHYLVTRGAPSWRIHRIGIFTHMNGWFFIGKYTGPMDSPGNQGSLNYAFFWEDQLVQMYGIFEGFFLWWCIVWVRNITWKQGRIFQMTKRWHCNEE